MRLRKWIVCWWILVSPVCIAATTDGVGHAAVAEGEPGPVLEYKVKAAFLYNFAKLVQWPATAFPKAETPLTIGVLGQDPFGADLDKTIAGKTIEGRHLAVERFLHLQDVKGCHLLFICASEKSQLPEILAKLRGQSVLTVGETAQFAELGGMIQLVKDHDRIRFAVNLDATKRAQLTISSKLLRLATIVKPITPPGGK